MHPTFCSLIFRVHPTFWSLKFVVHPFCSIQDAPCIQFYNIESVPLICLNIQGASSIEHTISDTRGVHVHAVHPGWIRPWVTGGFSLPHSWEDINPEINFSQMLHSALLYSNYTHCPKIILEMLQYRICLYWKKIKYQHNFYPWLLINKPELNFSEKCK